MTDDPTDPGLPGAAGLNDLLRSAAAGAAPLTATPSTVRHRAQARQRRRRVAGGAFALVLAGSAATAAVTLPSTQNDALTVAAASPSPSPSPSASASAAASPPSSLSASPRPSDTATAAPSPTRAPTAATPAASTATPSTPLELRGDDLGVTQIGDAKEDAIAAVSEVLGAADRSPAATRCVTAFTEASWKDLFLAFDENGRLSGWTVDTSRLTTPAGIRVGTTVAGLRKTYGDRLRIAEPNADSGHTYTVEGVSMVGSLTGATDSDRVTSLANGACTGP